MKACLIIFTIQKRDAFQQNQQLQFCTFAASFSKLDHRFSKTNEQPKIQRLKKLTSKNLIMAKKIKSALISVFYKDGLEPIVEELKKQGVTIYSTGGTQQFIENLGAEVVPVESITGFPSILDGRVKTLHPAVLVAY